MSPARNETRAPSIPQATNHTNPPSAAAKPTHIQAPTRVQNLSSPRGRRPEERRVAKDPSKQLPQEQNETNAPSTPQPTNHTNPPNTAAKPTHIQAPTRVQNLSSPRERGHR